MFYIKYISIKNSNITKMVNTKTNFQQYNAVNITQDYYKEYSHLATSVVEGVRIKYSKC